MHPEPTTASTLADLAVTEPAAARVFHQNGLDFCCGGRRPLADVCAERGLDANALLSEIAAGRGDAPATRWDERPLPELVAFIVDTYHQRLRAGMPELIALAEKVERRHGDKPGCPIGLATVLHRAYTEVLDHLEKEERVLFPLFLAGQGRHAVAPIHVMEREHDDHGRTLETLRELTGGYQPPEHACVSWRALYLGLEQFERELMDHIHLENHVLFPRGLAQ